MLCFHFSFFYISRYKFVCDFAVAHVLHIYIYLYILYNSMNICIPNKRLDMKFLNFVSCIYFIRMLLDSRLLQYDLKFSSYTFLFYFFVPSPEIWLSDCYPPLPPQISQLSPTAWILYQDSMQTGIITIQPLNYMFCCYMFKIIIATNPSIILICVANKNSEVIIISKRFHLLSFTKLKDINNHYNQHCTRYTEYITHLPNEAKITITHYNLI